MKRTSGIFRTEVIIGTGSDHFGAMVDSVPTGRAAEREYNELPHGLYHSSNNSG